MKLKLLQIHVYSLTHYQEKVSWDKKYIVQVRRTIRLWQEKNYLKKEIK